MYEGGELAEALGVDEDEAAETTPVEAPPTGPAPMSIENRLS